MDWDWTQVIIALLVGAGGVGIWQFFIVKSRLDAKERSDVHKAQIELRKEWREMADNLQAEKQAIRAEKAAIITERISDRHLWQERIATIEQRLQKTQAELSLTTSAYKEIRNELHKTQAELRTATAQLEIMKLKNGQLQKERDEWQAERNEWQKERDELHVRMRHLERILDKSGLETGPLDQGTEKE